MATTDSLSLLDAMRESIEALELEAALRDLGTPEQIHPLIAMLERIGRQAEVDGFLPLAAATAISEHTEPALREAIARIRQLLPDSAPPPCREEPGRPDVDDKPAGTSGALNQDPELISDFIMESREHLSAIEGQLLALEQDPLNTEPINTIFRGFHTIKGLAGFLDFPAIQSFAHEVETLLDLARNSRVPVNSALVDVILQSADYMNECLLGVESGREAVSGAGPLIERIRILLASDGITQVDGAGDLETNAADTTRPDLVHLAEAVARPPLAVNSPAGPGARASTSGPEAAVGPRAVKVDTGKLDYLVDMVGELVIAQSLIQHDPDLTAAQSARLLRNLSQLTRITGDVQRVAMAMRMLPVGQLFQRMARLVRDLARKSGKEATLELSGEDTELDRNMVEELADPLMHMIRNAVDHGAEPAADRIAAGKSPAARIGLKAYHQGGYINIEISDDGRGLVREKILAKARERGIVSGGDQLTDQEVFSFIFEPGFSTAAQLTDVSGRGVGMDVVRKQITKLRGRIDISSRPGKGTTFILKLPLTLAIIEGLVVGVGSQRYIVPIFAVKEMFRPAAENLSTVPDGGEMVLVRGSLLPILRLHSRFGVGPASENAEDGILIVVESARKSFCVLVDELIGKQEVVIKSLGETFRNVTGIAGGSILGDGRVGLILDVEALFASPSRQ